MVFKGTPTRGVGAVSTEIEGLGGELNAYTTVDHTVLHATVESSATVHALDVLADMATAPLLDPAETLNERDVVLDEIRSYADDAGSCASDLALDRCFVDHPYGRPVLGTTESVRQLDHDALRAFWRREWGAERAVLVIAGDVEPEAMLTAVRERLGGWHRSQAAPAVAAPPVAAPGWHLVSGRFDTPVVEMLWPLPAATHPDLPALEVACAIIGQSSASVLSLRLIHDDRTALGVSSYVQTWRDAGCFSIALSPNQGKEHATVQAVRDELNRLGAGPRPSDVVRARDSLLSDQIYSAETVDGIASDLLDAVAVLGDVEAQTAYRGRLAAVRPDDVARVVRTWLDPNGAVIASTAPASSEAPAVLKPVTAPGPERIVRDDGVTLLLLPDRSPVASIRCAGLGGALNIGDRRAGIASAWSSVATAGAGRHDATALARAVEDLSGALGAVAGRNSVGLSATFPAERFAAGLDLFGEVLTEPHFDDEEWERVRDEMIEDERSVRDRPGQIASRHMWQALYRGHPWRLPGNGTTASLMALRPSHLRRWHEQQLTADNLVIAIAGGFHRDEVLEALDPWLAALPAGPYQIPERPAPGPIARRRIEDRAGNEQTWVSIAWRGPGMHDPDRSAIDLAATALAGGSGRLFMSLRERMGLAYSVGASSTPGWDGGLVTAGLATDPERAEEAENALWAELVRFAEEGPTEEEVARCVRLSIGATAMSLQRASGRAAAAALGERYGTIYHLDDIRAELEALRPSDVRDAWARLVASDDVRIVVRPR